MTNATHLHTLSVADALDAAVLCAHARVPVQLLGSPGVGKSAVAPYLAAHFGLPCLVYHLPLWVDASDGRGLPDFSPRDDAGRRLTYYATPAHLPTDPTVVGLDELTAARSDVKLLMYDFLLSGRIGEYTLPEGSIIFATGNARSHGAGATSTNSALDNRLCHLSVAASLEAVEEWSLGTSETHCALPSVHPYPCGSTGLPTRLLPSHEVLGRLHPLILAFLRRRPSLLDTFDTRTLTDPAYATPRTWEMASRVLRAIEALDSGWYAVERPSYAPNTRQANAPSSTQLADSHPGKPTGTVPKATRRHVMAGLLGTGTAHELEAFLDLKDTLPDPRTIDAHPLDAPVPTDPAALYALTAMLAHTITKENVEARLRYGVRLPAEFSILFYNDAFKRHSMILNTCRAHAGVNGEDGLQLHYFALGCRGTTKS